MLSVLEKKDKIDSRDMAMANSTKNNINSSSMATYLFNNPVQVKNMLSLIDKLEALEAKWEKLGV